MGRGAAFRSFAILLLCAASCEAVACVKADTRFAASSNTLYIETPVVCTPAQLAAFLKPAVLELVDPVAGIWLLKANLRISAGGTLRLYGPGLGGDTGEFRLLSSNSPAAHVKLTARWGAIDIRSTHVRSWDPSSGGPDLDTANGRAYIHAESFLDGATARESRLDVIDSEVDHLGYYAAVSYGLVWKVIGDPGEVPDLYDRVNVHGDVLNSYVHHNYMGFYSFGGESIRILDSEFAYNESYGIDPHDDSDRLVISGNHSHHNGAHGIICSRRCNDLVITDNEVHDNDHGIMLHRDVIDTLVANNNVHHNRDNGIAVFESHYNTVRDNIVEFNKEGIRLSLGSHDNLIRNNVVRGNAENGLYLYQGSDPPETTDGRPRANVFRDNTVIGNKRLIKARSSDDITFTGNIFNGSTSDIEIYDSSGIDIVGNIDQLAVLEVASSGVESGSSYVRLEADRAVKVKIDAQGAVDVTNPQGRLLDPEENSGSIAIGAGGSRTSLTYSLIGTSTNISALPVYATTATGSFTVEAPAVSQSRTAFTVRSLTAGQGGQFRVAQLTPGVLYRIFRNNVQIMSLSSGSLGELVFSDTFGAGVFTYEIRR